MQCPTCKQDYVGKILTGIARSRWALSFHCLSLAFLLPFTDLSLTFHDLLLPFRWEQVADHQVDSDARLDAAYGLGL